MSGIYVGSAEIGSLFVGSTEIAQAYVGSSLIWPSTPPGAFATFDPTRKGADVTLLESNLRAQVLGVEMVCATNPQTKGSGLYYCEIVRNDALAGFLGVGITKAGTATDSYQGAYVGQASVWQDSSNDNGGGMDVSPNRPNYSAELGIKLLFGSVGLMLGRIGGGWWSTVTQDWDADPLDTDNCVIRSIDPGDYSIGITGLDAIDVTANFGSSAWLDTPPTGAVGWPG